MSLLPPTEAGIDPAPATVAADLDALPDAVLVVGADGRILRANQAAVGLLGYSPDELIGASCAEVTDARYLDGSAVWAEGWDRGTRLRSVRRLAEQTVTVRPHRRRPIVVAVTGAYRRQPGGVLSGVVLCLRPLRDGSGRRHGLETMAAASHELRAPLATIRGFTALLLGRWDSIDDEDKRRMLGEVSHEAGRVGRLIGELLDVSRLQSGKLALHRRWVDIPALAASVIGKVRLAHPDLDVGAAWADGFPAVQADPDKVEQVLTNLVENACKYGSPTGVLITGIVITGEGGTRGVAVTVADGGAGLAATELAAVFTPSFRRREGQPDGLGLGLWISRGLVEAHGGRLTASSILGEGSAFRFTLPLIDLEDLTRP